MKTVFRRQGAYYFSEAFKSIRRNGFLSLATVTTVTVSLFILGAIALLVMNTSSYLDGLEQDVEISAFIDQTYTDEQALLLADRLRSLPGASEVIFVSRQEAMESMQGRYSKSGYDLEETMESNPLPNSYRIKAADPHGVKALAQSVSSLEGIYRVNYGQDIVDQLFSITKGVRWGGGCLVGMIIIGAVFLIGINIRLSIYSRRQEIYLMKLIGARDSFITRPFYIEGIFLAVMGAVAAGVLLFGGYELLLRTWAETSFSMVFPLVTDYYQLLPCYGILLGVGLVLGWLGTAISVHRFMDV